MSTKQPYDGPSYFDRVIQQLDTQTRRLAKDLDDERTMHVAFSAIDATNIVLSGKLYFEAKYSTSNISQAEITAEWRNFIFSLEGGILTAIELAFLVSLASFGSYFEDDDKEYYHRIWAILWPYIRDVLKAIKWAYRATRNWLQIAIHFSDVDLRYLILPIGLALGVVALLNRIWQRSMKQERKEMQKSNNKLYLEIINKSNAIHFLTKAPSTNDTLINSYVYVKGYAKACGLVQRRAPLTDKILQEILDNLPPTLDATYIYSENAIYYLDKITREIKLVCDDAAKIKQFLQTLKPSNTFTTLSTDQLKTIATTINHQHETLKRQLNYIDANGNKIAVPLDDLDLFEQDCQLELDENIRSVLANKLPAVRAKKATLQFVPQLPETILPSHWNAYLYITDDSKAKEKLVWIDKTGKQQSVPYDVRQQFEKDYQQAQQNKNLTGLSADQIKTIIKKRNGTITHPLGLSLEYWDKYKKQAKAKIKLQQGTLPLRSYISAFIRSFIDNAYFQGGAAFLAEMNPVLFITVVAFSATYFVLWLIGSMYDEYAFQQKLKATATRDELALCAKELDILLTELGQISEKAAMIDEQNGLKAKELETQQKQLMQRFNKLCKEYDQYHTKLHSQIVHTYTTAGLAGLSNGLAVLSAIAGFMFAASAIAFLFGIPTSPWFVLSCMVACMVAVIACITQGILSHQFHMSKTGAQKPPRICNDVGTILKNAKLRREGLGLQAEEVAEVKNTIWGNSIDPSPQFYIMEWAEIIRLTWKGFYNGEKIPGDLVKEKGAVIFMVMAIGSLSAGVIYATRAMAKLLSGSTPAKVEQVKLNRGNKQKSANNKPPAPNSTSPQSSNRHGFYSQTQPNTNNAKLKKQSPPPRATSPNTTSKPSVAGMYNNSRPQSSNSLPSTPIGLSLPTLFT